MYRWQLIQFVLLILFLEASFKNTFILSLMIAISMKLLEVILF